MTFELYRKALKKATTWHEFSRFVAEHRHVFSAYELSMILEAMREKGENLLHEVRLSLMGVSFSESTATMFLLRPKKYLPPTFLKENTSREPLSRPDSFA